MARKKLSDILSQNERESLARSWDSTAPADKVDRSPIPAGTYRCRILEGTLFTAKSGSKGYKLTFEVADGEHAGRRIWFDVWLTDNALPYAKRELAKLGVTRLDQLEQPLPARFVVNVTVRIERGDDGNSFNKVAGFDDVELEQNADSNPFAPQRSDASQERERFEL